MSDVLHSRPDGGGLFDAIDPRLNVFALANGMDLLKGDGYRRLEWFTEGLERAIVIEAGSTESFHVRVVSWRTGSTEVLGEAELGDDLSGKEVGSVLDTAIDAANGL